MMSSSVLLQRFDVAIGEMTPVTQEWVDAVEAKLAELQKQLREARSKLLDPV